jgi:hypothetical protein
MTTWHAPRQSERPPVRRWPAIERDKPLDFRYENVFSTALIRVASLALTQRTHEL